MLAPGFFLITIHHHLKLILVEAQTHQRSGVALGVAESLRQAVLGEDFSRTQCWNFAMTASATSSESQRPSVDHDGSRIFQPGNSANLAERPWVRAEDTAQLLHLIRWAD